MNNVIARTLEITKRSENACVNLPHAINGKAAYIEV